MPGVLYIVSTPIGNLGDITFRAVNILKDVDIIACEDTRHTKKLLNHYGITNSLTSYHEHNEDSKTKKLLCELEEGKNIALVSDAGTPCISDPGYKLVSVATENGIRVVTIPGANSIISALTISGLPTGSFSFLGFLPRTKKQIMEIADKVKFHDSTLIFFESPNRIKKSLGYLKEGLGNRNVSLCRELTKLHEEVLRGSLEEISEALEIKDTVKGEICLIIEGFKRDKEGTSNNISILADKKLKSLKNLDISLKDAVKVVSQELEISKKTTYQKALKIWDN